MKKNKVVQTQTIREQILSHLCLDDTPEKDIILGFLSLHTGASDLDMFDIKLVDTEQSDLAADKECKRLEKLISNTPLKWRLTLKCHEQYVNSDMVLSYYATKKEHIVLYMYSDSIYVKSYFYKNI